MKYYVFHSDGKKYDGHYGVIFSRGYWRVDIIGGEKQYPRGPYKTSVKATDEVSS